MTIKQEDNQVVVTRPNDLKKMKSLHGLTTVSYTHLDVYKRQEEEMVKLLNSTRR